MGGAGERGRSLKQFRPLNSLNCSCIYKPSIVSVFTIHWKNCWSVVMIVYLLHATCYDRGWRHNNEKGRFSASERIPAWREANNNSKVIDKCHNWTKCCRSREKTDFAWDSFLWRWPSSWVLENEQKKCLQCPLGIFAMHIKFLLC